MLASTVQFSTTNQSPSARPHQTPTRPLAGTSTVERCEIRRAPDRDNRPLPRREPARRGPLPQDPTACLPPPHPRGPLPRPPAGGPYWGPVKPAAELVSVPPSSTPPTAFARPPEMGPGSRSGRGSAPPGPEAGGRD